MTEMEAYDALDRDVRDALKDASPCVSALRALDQNFDPEDVYWFADRLAWRLDGET